MVFYVFGDTIDFILGLMDSDLWIGCRNAIDLAGYLLFFENGSFSDIDGKFGLASGQMGRNQFLFELGFFDHQLEVNIDVFAGCYIEGLFLLLLLLGVLHLLTTLLSLLFNFFDCLHASLNLGSNLNLSKL